MTSGRCYITGIGVLQRGGLCIQRGARTKPKTPTNIDEAPTGALLRDTGGIRSILLATLIDEQPRWRTRTNLEFTSSPGTLAPTLGPVDASPPNQSYRPVEGGYFSFFFFFIFRLCNGQLIYYATGFLQQHILQLPFCYTMTNTFDKLLFSHFFFF